MQTGRNWRKTNLLKALLKQSPRLTRFGSAMTVIAAVAPLMGLLGTVTGMISTFDVITEHGTEGEIHACFPEESPRRLSRRNWV